MLILASRNVTAFADLIAEITGHRLRRAPWLAPALLFSAPEVQSSLSLPQPGANEVLLHDYQAIQYQADFPQDIPVTALISDGPQGSGREFTIRFGEPLIADLRTALRVAPQSALASAKPMRFSAQLQDIGAQISLSPGQVARYLDLSGDRNPIHHDESEVKRLALPAPIVPGMLLVSLVQSACEARLQTNLASLRARFAAPLWVGQSFQIGLQDRGPGKLRGLILNESHAYCVVDMTFS